MSAEGVLPTETTSGRKGDAVGHPAEHRAKARQQARAAGRRTACPCCNVPCDPAQLPQTCYILVFSMYLPPPCMRHQPFEYRHVPTGTCHDLGCMYASRRAECGLFLCRNPVRGSSDLARVCRRVGMEGGAPPEGGLESPVNTTLPPESGGVGTQPNTFNDTPGNTTHGTLHHAGGAAGSATSISQAAFSQSDSLAGINSNPQAARSIGPASSQPINTPTTLSVTQYPRRNYQGLSHKSIAVRIPGCASSYINLS